MHLYISNLSMETIQTELKDIFRQYGCVTLVEIQRDPLTGNPLGGAVVTIPRQAQAVEAMKALNLTKIKGRTILVSPTTATGDRRAKSRLKTDTEESLKTIS